MSSDLSELDNLLAGAMQESREGTEARRARERMKQVHGVTARERLEDAERIAAWEAKHEWRALANVALFHEHVCTTCNTFSMTFSHYLERQEHRHMRKAQRWVKVETTKAILPNEVVRKVHYTSMCEDCAEQNGWRLHDATVWKD